MKKLLLSLMLMHAYQPIHAMLPGHPTTTQHTQIVLRPVVVYSIFHHVPVVVWQPVLQSVQKTQTLKTEIAQLNAECKQHILEFQKALQKRDEKEWKELTTSFREEIGGITHLIDGDGEQKTPLSMEEMHRYVEENMHILQQNLADIRDLLSDDDDFNKQREGISRSLAALDSVAKEQGPSSKPPHE